MAEFPQERFICSPQPDESPWGQGKVRLSSACHLAAGPAGLRVQRVLRAGEPGEMEVGLTHDILPACFLAVGGDLGEDRDGSRAPLNFLYPAQGLAPECPQQALAQTPAPQKGPAGTACASTAFIIRQRLGLTPKALSFEKGLALGLENLWFPFAHEGEGGWVVSGDFGGKGPPGLDFPI